MGLLEQFVRLTENKWLKILLANLCERKTSTENNLLKVQANRLLSMGLLGCG
jgi:hypothetical protein